MNKQERKKKQKREHNPTLVLYHNHTYIFYPSLKIEVYIYTLDE